MINSESEWVKYRSTVREFDAVLDHAKAVSTSIVGITPTARHVSYGEQIFVKLLGHCITLRNLAPDPTRRTPSELWDLSSMSSVARCAIEAHDAFAYIVLGDISMEERAFRLRLWLLHDKNRRRKMLHAIGSTNPKTEQVRIEAARLLQETKEDPFLETLQSETRRKILSDDPPAYYHGHRERCEMSGINFDYYNAVTMQLSQYVHTLPFSIHQLFAFRAGTADALALMALPLQYVLPFLSRVTGEMRLLFPTHTPPPPSRTARTMTLWKTLSMRGVKCVDQLSLE